MDVQERNDSEYGKFTLDHVDTRVFNLEDFGRRRRLYRCAVVFLGLLCVVLLAVTVGQMVNKKNENHPELEDRPQSEALSAEKERLWHNWTVIQNQNQRLQLQKQILTLEKEQLQRNYTIVQRVNEHLQAEIHDLREKVEVMEAKIRHLECPTGWHKFGMNCYYKSVTKFSWVTSRLTCVGMGADLVSINTVEEQAFINTLLDDQQNAWIGLTDYFTEGMWKWLDGSPVTKTFWSPGQPNSYNGTEQDCGEIVENSLMGEWNDEGCTAQNIWICEN